MNRLDGDLGIGDEPSNAKPALPPRKHGGYNNAAGQPSSGVDDVKQMLTYFMRCRGLKRLEGELNTIRLQMNSQASLLIDDWQSPLLTIMSCTLAFTYTSSTLPCVGRPKL